MADFLLTSLDWGWGLPLTGPSRCLLKVRRGKVAEPPSPAKWRPERLQEPACYGSYATWYAFTESILWSCLRSPGYWWAGQLSPANLCQVNKAVDWRAKSLTQLDQTQNKNLWSPALSLGVKNVTACPDSDLFNVCWMTLFSLLMANAVQAEPMTTDFVDSYYVGVITVQQSALQWQVQLQQLHRQAAAVTI